jgi:hypothetical protein
MENNQHEHDDKNDETRINIDEWLYALLAMTGDKERREKLIRQISEKTGQPPEQVEIIISATIKYLADASRSN